MCKTVSLLTKNLVYPAIQISDPIDTRRDISYALLYLGKPCAIVTPTTTSLNSFFRIFHVLLTKFSAVRLRRGTVMDRPAKEIDPDPGRDLGRNAPMPRQ